MASNLADGLNENHERADADLARLAQVATELGVGSLVAAIADERQRLADARFFVACVGQFKRGKSTVLNALVGHPVLPVGVVPVTSVITILREGRRPEALVRFASGRTETIGIEHVADLVDERRNPENKREVAVVEVFLPSPVLANGLCLVDTPGIGSIFSGNTETTRTFLPHIDVALLIVGPDPPITGDELEMTVRLASEVTYLLLVLNKADLAPPEQRHEVMAFTSASVERRLGRGFDERCEVSALERSRDNQPTRDWRRLENTLREFANTRRSALVVAGTGRARVRLAALDVARRAHTMAAEQVQEQFARFAALRNEVQQVQPD